MSGKSRPQSVDSIIGALAGLQHGAVGRWQLLARGVSSDQIDRRLKSGYLIPIHRGVYLVGHVATAPLAYEAAAILAFRGQATISHRSAASLLGLLPWPPKAACWVTTPLGDSERPGLIVRKATLEPSDIATVERIKVTTAARTILDCAAVLPPAEDDRLEGMAAQAHALKLAKAPDLWDQIDRNPGKPGVVRLGKLLSKHAPKRTKLELERRLLRLVRSSDLPEPEVNAFVEGKERDLVWREQRVVVEADSYTFHSDARTWARDIGKTNDLQLANFISLRFTWFDVTERPERVLTEIREALWTRST
jgi:very-short-patch-repair endonuclease